MLAAVRWHWRLAIAAMFVAFQAAAEPTAADKASARSMLDEGYALLGKGDAVGALKRFVGADVLVSLPPTKLAVAKAHLALNHLVEAEDVLAAAMRAPVVADEPAAMKKARSDAAELFAQTTPRIPELTIAIKGPRDGLVVKVDGVVVPAEALVAPRRLNPGAHTIEATSSNGATGTASATLAEGEKGNVALELTGGQDKPLVATPPTDPANPPAASDGGGLSPVVIGGFAIGVVGVGIGSVTGLMAIGRQGSAEDNGCVSNKCPPSAHDDVDAAKSLATVSTIGFVIGGIALVTAAVYFISHASSHKP